MPLVIVVDNGYDDTRDLDELFPRVRFIRLPRDFGLTKALNLGIRAADAEMVFFLSPDVEISPSAIAALADTLESNPGIGAVCPLLLDAAPQVSALPTHRSPIRRCAPPRPANPSRALPATPSCFARFSCAPCATSTSATAITAAPSNSASRSAAPIRPSSSTPPRPPFCTRGPRP